jgi:hypothetical protein
MAMSWRCSLLAVVLLAATPVFAEPPRLAFKPAGAGLYDFDTGVFQGRLKADGKYQGIYPMVDADSRMELVHPPGIFSLYRVFTTNKRYGETVRDWPTKTRLLADGAVEVLWPAAAEHPLEIAGVYRWKAADALDLEITVKPQHDMPRFELFMSSYFTKSFRAAVYMKPEGRSDARPAFVPIDRKPQSTGAYVMYPRDEDAVRMIQDGRWKLGSNPVDWALERWLAAPIVMRRDATHGLVALMMCPPEDCFAIASPWNPTTPDAPGYRSIYLSFLGRDLRAGQPAHVRCRLVIAHKMTDQEALEKYESYLGELKR